MHPLRPGLLLVRHAMPAVHPDTDPATWGLGEEGRAAATVLVLPAGAHLVASAEPKAIGTLAAHGTVTVDPDLGEVRRDEPFGDGFRERRAAYVGGADHPGWEPREQVADRFEQAVRRAEAAAAGRPVVVGSHGMAMTLWLDRRGLLEDPVAFWSALAFPDVVDVAALGG